MDSAPTPSKISRIDLRFRHLAQDISPDESVRTRAAGAAEEEEEFDEPLPIRDEIDRGVMGRAHRMFHRRKAAEEPNVLTMVVEVVATLDVEGNVIAKETNTPELPQVPSVPAVPSVLLPSAPGVPPFPSELTVPAYPWPSGVPTVPASSASSQLVISSALSATPNDASTVPTIPQPTTASNSTISSTAASSSILLSTSNSTFSSSASSSSSRSSSTTSVSLSPTSSHSSTSTTSASSSASASSSDVASSGTVVLGPGGAPVNTAPPPAASSAAASGSSDDDNPLDTPETVGTVIGSLAGAALIFALLLFLLKRHKQKKRRGALELSGTDTADNQPLPAAGQEMASRSSFIPAGVVPFFNRFSGASRSTVDTSATTERGFQRISGRKLPSAFSEGMTSEQFARGEGTLSGSSFYRDDQGVYGGPGIVGKDMGKEIGGPSNSGAMGTKERIMPSPARTPVIHHPDDAPAFGASRNGGGGDGVGFSPPHTPNTGLPPTRPTLGRSHPSHDGSRGSRFTEDV